MRITFEQLLAPPDKTPLDRRLVDVILLRLTSKLQSSTLTHATPSLIYAWDTLGPDIRDLFGWHGGDEEWLVLVSKEFEWCPPWLDQLGEFLDVYVLPNFVVYVASHA